VQIGRALFFWSALVITLPHSSHHENKEDVDGTLRYSSPVSSNSLELDSSPQAARCAGFFSSVRGVQPLATPGIERYIRCAIGVV
jgi:hypothetical protein